MASRHLARSSGGPRFNYCHDETFPVCALRHGSINWSTARCSWALRLGQLHPTPPFPTLPALPLHLHYQFPTRWPLLVSARNLVRHQALLTRIWHCFYLFVLSSLCCCSCCTEVLSRRLARPRPPPCMCHTGAACITPTLTAALELQVCKQLVPSCICTCVLIAIAIFISSFYCSLISCSYCVCV